MMAPCIDDVVAVGVARCGALRAALQHVRAVASAAVAEVHLQSGAPCGASAMSQPRGCQHYECTIGPFANQVTLRTQSGVRIISALSWTSMCMLMLAQGAAQKLKMLCAEHAANETAGAESCARIRGHPDAFSTRLGLATHAQPPHREPCAQHHGCSALTRVEQRVTCGMQVDIQRRLAPCQCQVVHTSCFCTRTASS